MAFCPRCGAPTTPGQSFCGSCGERASAPSIPPPAPPAPYAAAPPLAAPLAHPAPPPVSGPPGTTREPIITILLAIVTLGIYGLYYWWVTSEEADTYTNRPGHAHHLIRWGTILALVTGAAFVFLLATLVFAVIAADATGADPGPAIVGSLIGSIALLVLAGAGMAAGAILRLVGKWRLWSALEAHQRARGMANPLSAALMLGLSIGAWFVPFVGWVLPLVVLYLTQESLNQTWRAEAGSTAPPAAWR